MPIELKVPAVGESVSEIFIGKWYKSEGDRVEPDEGLVEVESEKATLDVPSPAGGVLIKILKQSGETAQIGEVIAQIDAHAARAEPPSTQRLADQHASNGADAGGNRVMAERAISPADPQQGAAQPVDVPAPAQTPPYSTPNSPREKWIIRQEPAPAPPAAPPSAPSPSLGQDEATHRTSETPSESGAVVSRPARQEPESQGTLSPTAPSRPAPVVAQAATGMRQPDAETPSYAIGLDREEETVPLSPIRRRIAARLVEAQHKAALLTTFNEVDMTAVKELRAQYGEAFQTRYGVKLGFMSFFVKAVIEALKQCPELNAIIEGDSIVYRRYYDIGVAIGSSRGLVVPVLRNAQQMTFAEVETTIEDFAKRAQTGDLRVDELQGGTFTISNGGVYGSLLSTPIVNPPQSGVLGMHAIQDRPVAVAGHVAIRPMMYVALSYDHRIVDGREAVTFLRRVKESVEGPTRMLLEV